MPDYYVDSSALVKRYVRETGSEWVSNLFSTSLGNEMFVSLITPVEILAAISRRARGGTLSPADAAGACSVFKTDLLSDYQIVEVTGSIATRAMALAETHALRGYDAVQLAAAL